MKKYIFIEDIDHYKKDEIIKVEKVNNLLQKWLKEKKVKEVKEIPKVEIKEKKKTPTNKEATKKSKK